jgi:hypothetical protein
MKILEARNDELFGTETLSETLSMRSIYNLPEDKEGNV